jgi:hypothetical protein
LIAFFRHNGSTATTPNGQKFAKNGVEELKPEIFLPSRSSFGPGTLLISRDGDDDVSSVRISTTARTSTSEVEYSHMTRSPPIQSQSSIPNGYETRQTAKRGCDMLVLLRTCWSWFCGLDDTTENEESATTETDAAYHRLQRNLDSTVVVEEDDSMLQHSKERPLIKWILNGNLVFLILLEIALFVVFSLPVKYTFGRE